MGRGLALAALSSLALASPAAASIQFSDTNVLRPSLQVNRKGEALVTYCARAAPSGVSSSGER